MAHSVTSVRGSSKTHTIQMELEYALGVLRSTDVNPDGTLYKRKYGDLINARKKADLHLRYEDTKDLDQAYVETLEELIQSVDSLLDEVDAEGDLITKRIRDKERLMKHLPRSSPQKWDGTMNDFPRFKQEAHTLIDHSPTNGLAMNSILGLILDNKIRKRLAKYETPQEALKSLELEFGNPELSGPKIIDDMKRLCCATNTESESALILKLKELYVSLRHIKQEHLLGRNELYNLCHKFRDYEGGKLLGKLYTEEPDNLRDVFFDHLEDLYTTNTIWIRTDLKRSEKPRETFGGHTNNGKIGTESENVECTFCRGNHFNHQCNDLDEVDLNQVQELQLCPHCLWNQHDEECPHLKKATFLCKQCKLHYKLKKLHVNCKRQDITKPGPPLQESRFLDEQFRE